MSRKRSAPFSLDDVFSALGCDRTSLVLDFLGGSKRYWQSRYRYVERSLIKLGTRLSNDHCVTISHELDFDGFPARWKAAWKDVLHELYDTLGDFSDGDPRGVADELPVFQFCARRRCCVECLVVSDDDGILIYPQDWCTHPRCHELSRDPSGDFLNIRLWDEHPPRRIANFIHNLLRYPCPRRWVGGVTPRVWTVHMQRNWRDRFDAVIAQVLHLWDTRERLAIYRIGTVHEYIDRRICAHCAQERCATEECVTLTTAR
jgi:hypothetical protein